MTTMLSQEEIRKQEEARPPQTPWSPPPVGWPESYKAQPTVTMVFPHRVSVQLDDGAGLIHFNSGVQEVPVSLENHWYLKQNKVVRYKKAEAPVAELSEHHVKFLQSCGVNVRTVAGVKAYVDNLDSQGRALFFAESIDWEEPKSEPKDSDEDEAEIPLVDSEPAPALVTSQELEESPAAEQARSGRKKRS